MPLSFTRIRYIWKDKHDAMTTARADRKTSLTGGISGKSTGIETGRVFERVFERGAYQEPITWSEQLPRPLVTASSRTILFLERFWRKFRISFKSHKPVSKTYRPENDNLFLFNDVTFSFMISYISIAFIDAAEIPFSREKLP